MANREALRELQGRLAARMKASGEEQAQAAWLAVEAGGRQCLLPLAQSGEIFSPTALQPVPRTQAWFLGVANLRGGLWGAVDLAAFLAAGDGAAARPVGDRRPDAPPADAARAPARLVGLNPLLEVNCALQVDRLAGLRGATDFTASEPSPAGAPAWFGSRFQDTAGAWWQELDLQALCRQPRFLDITA